MQHVQWQHIPQSPPSPLTVRRESNSGAYFAGMFRVAHVDFIPEYRQEESQEFVSMANKIQHVVRLTCEGPIMEKKKKL